MKNVIEGGDKGILRIGECLEERKKNGTSARERTVYW